MQILLITSVIVLYSFQTLFQTLYSKHYTKGASLAGSVFCFIESMVIFLVTLAFNKFKIHLSVPTIVLGVLNAIMLYVFNIGVIQGTRLGSYAFLNMILVFGSILVPAFYSLVVLKDPFRWYMWVGLILMLVSITLMNIKGVSLKGSQKLYYLFLVLLFFSNGFYCTFLKVQEVKTPLESKEMIMLTFLLTMIPAGISLLRAHKKDPSVEMFKMNKKAALFLALALLSAALAINVLILIMPMINVVVLFVVQAGGSMLLSFLYSVVLFKEKMDFIKVAGVICAIISMTLMSL